MGERYFLSRQEYNKATDVKEYINADDIGCGYAHPGDCIGFSMFIKSQRGRPLETFAFFSSQLIKHLLYFFRR